MNAPLSPKKWVFTEIIEHTPIDSNDQDVLGIVAYALYKKDKRDLAESLRLEQVSEEEIQQKLEDFHHQVATIPQRQKRYKDQAETVLIGTIRLMMETSFAKKKEELLDKATQLNKQTSQLEEREKKMESTIKKQVDDQVRKARVEIRKEELDRLMRASKDAVSPPWYIRAALWLWSGFSGVFATIAVGWLIYSIAANNASPETKQKLLREFVESTVTTISGTSQTSTSTR